jgi:methylenetetrahydrofolate dehydrogenase (NADP+)/methenyltetrahydrofolate cyclohydrolase
MRFLNGSELADFIKERHAHQVRALRAAKIYPKLAIIRTNKDPVVDTYMRLKSSYGQDILVDVDVHDVPQADAIATIKRLNDDPGVHGIIVQIPLPDASLTDQTLNAVAPEKDVDGLNESTLFSAATPTAIDWLLNGYNVELKGKKIVIVGQGRLVGKPLLQMWQQSGLDVSAADKDTKNLEELVKAADIVVSATGKPGLINSELIKQGATVVDAGASTDSNGLVGDIAPDVRTRDDLTITPVSGGVGPLTVAALFENVIRAAGSAAKN